MPESLDLTSHGAGDAASCSSVPAVSTVLLVEELVAVRWGIRLLIEAEPDFAVCGGASTLKQALEGQWEPDLVVHGLVFPEATGAPVVTALRGRFPRAALVALTRLDAPVHAHLAIGAGDSGYVLKTASPTELVDALRKVAGGEEWVYPSLGAQLARWDEIPRRHDESSLFDLTQREEEVLELLALGYTNAEVARTLCVSLRTVETHRTHVMQKLNLRTRAEMVRFVSEQQHSSLGR
jgi:DNA-binding NarL/FixJ family response regulator